MVSVAGFVCCPRSGIGFFVFSGNVLDVRNFSPSRRRGGRIQESSSGQPNGALPLVRGVVLNVRTYEEDRDGFRSVSVYCDVLVYSGHPAMRREIVRDCVVVQPVGTGMHDGVIRVPRACRSAPVDSLRIAPDQLDGDHVLVDWIDGDWGSPVIAGTLPHPRQDESLSGSESVGLRRRLVSSDGHPCLERHLGAVWGMESSGDWMLDLRRAHPDLDGVDSEGREPRLDSDPESIGGDLLPTGGESGNGRIRLREGSTLVIEIDGGPTLTVAGKAGDAALTLGDGSRSVALAEELSALWGALKAAFDAHTHTSGSSGAPTSPPVSTAPSWDSSIVSGKAKVPAG